MSLKNCAVSVFGLGLIGGSLSWKLRRDGLVQDVAGWSRNPETVRRAMDSGIIGTGCVSAEECAALGDVLVLAVPIRSMEEVSLKIRSAARPDIRAVFDLASTKTVVGRKLAPIWGRCYAGFHPMAGKERGGLENADPDLFREAVCAVVPFETTDPSVTSLAKELAEALGGKVLLTDAAAHDAAAGCVSHLPVLLAASLALLAGREQEKDPLVSLLAAGGFRDTTRVAGGPPWLGADMAVTNGEQVKRLARDYKAILDGLLRATPAELEALLQQASAVRERIFDGKKRWTGEKR